MNVTSGELLLFRTLWNTSNDNMLIVSIDNDGEFLSEATNAAQVETALLYSSLNKLVSTY